MKRLTTAIQELKQAFPKISGIRAAEEWDPSLKDAIHLGDAAEGGTINDCPACHYYNSDHQERIYIMGVHKQLVSKLEDLGFYAECYDPGTYVAFRN